MSTPSLRSRIERVFPLPIATAVLFVAAAFSFAVGATALAGLSLTLALLLPLFGRPRSFGWGRHIILAVAIASVAAAALLPDLALATRLDRILVIVAIAVYLAFYEVAPAASNLKPIRPIADICTWVIAALFLFGPLVLASVEYMAGNAVTSFFHRGVASNVFTQTVLLRGIAHHTFELRGAKIYATSMLFDSLHAARFDDNTHIARLATQTLPLQMTPCTLDPDPPATGYAGPGFGQFIRQITAHCRR